MAHQLGEFPDVPWIRLKKRRPERGPEVIGLYVHLLDATLADPAVDTASQSVIRHALALLVKEEGGGGASPAATTTTSGSFDSRVAISPRRSCVSGEAAVCKLRFLPEHGFSGEHALVVPPDGHPTQTASAPGSILAPPLPTIR